MKSMVEDADLDGWVKLNTAEGTWDHGRDLLWCSGKPLGVLRTEEMLQNFVLEVEVRKSPGEKVGLVLWSDDLPAVGSPYPRGIEVTFFHEESDNGVLSGGRIDALHGAKMTPQRDGLESPVKTGEDADGEWSRYRLECRDGTVSLAVDGVEIDRVEDCTPRKGYLSMKSSGDEIVFRNLVMKELPETKVEPAQVATENRDFRSLYNGLDFTDWQTPRDDWEIEDWKITSLGSGKGEGLWSEMVFDDYEFVFDVSLESRDVSVDVVLRGSSAKFNVNYVVFPELNPPGKWNRFTGVIRDGVIEGTVNGKPWRKDVGDSTRGMFGFEPMGPAEFANVFIREL